jgi:hypothetical protein
MPLAFMWLAGTGVEPKAAAGPGIHHSQLRHVMNFVYRLAPHPHRTLRMCDQVRAGSGAGPSGRKIDPFQRVKACPALG